MAEAAKSLLEKARRIFGAAAEDLTADEPARTLDAVDGRPLPKRQLRDDAKRPYPLAGVVRG